MYAPPWFPPLVWVSSRCRILLQPWHPRSSSSVRAPGAMLGEGGVGDDVEELRRPPLNLQTKFFRTGEPGDDGSFCISCMVSPMGKWRQLSADDTSALVPRRRTEDLSARHDMQRAAIPAEYKKPGSQECLTPLRVLRR